MKLLRCLFPVVLLWSACSPAHKEPKPTPETRQAPGQKSKPEKHNPDVARFDYMIFGTYAGECRNNCAVMFRVNFGQGYPLLADYTDSFFKPGSKVVCETRITDTAKLKLVDETILHIPAEILKAEEDRRYGCPDCTDGGGVYFELSMDSVAHKFYIDLHDPNLEVNISKFAGYIQELSYKLRK